MNNSQIKQYEEHQKNLEKLIGSLETCVKYDGRDVNELDSFISKITNEYENFTNNDDPNSDHKDDLQDMSDRMNTFYEAWSHLNDIIDFDTKKDISAYNLVDMKNADDKMKWLFVYNMNIQHENKFDVADSVKRKKYIVKLLKLFEELIMISGQIALEKTFFEDLPDYLSNLDDMNDINNIDSAKDKAGEINDYLEDNKELLDTLEEFVDAYNELSENIY